MRGVVAVDLSVDVFAVDGPRDWNRDRRALAVLETCPDGAGVLVDIGSRTFASPDAALFLHEHDRRLVITIVGVDPRGVASFIEAGRLGVVGGAA